MSDWKPTGKSWLRRKWFFWHVQENEERREVEDDAGLRLGFYDAKPRIFEQRRWVRSTAQENQP